jgi:hypothetical protein
MVTVQFSPLTTATVEGGTWRSKHKGMERYLNATIVDTAGDDPDPDHTKAMEAIRIFGGKITKHIPPPFDPKVIY